MAHSKAVTDHETDLRFWKQTGDDTHATIDILNPEPEERALVSVWLAINRQVLAEDAAGRLQLTSEPSEANASTYVDTVSPTRVPSPSSPSLPEGGGGIGVLALLVIAYLVFSKKGKR